MREREKNARRREKEREKEKKRDDYHGTRSSSFESIRQQEEATAAAVMEGQR